MNKYIIIFLFSVFISSISQILLKKSANIHYENRIREYLNIRVIIAYGIFFTSSLITIVAYKGVPLSLGPILESTGYIWVAILGRICLKEKIEKRKLSGLLLIILGVAVANVL